MSTTLHPAASADATSTIPATWSRPVLRTASALYVLYASAHTFGGMLADHRRGAPQAALFAAMRDYTFQVQGVTRSYWDFYRGFGFITSITLALAAALCWVLAGMSRTHPAQARSIVAVLLACMLPMTWLAYVDFFAGPIVFSTVTTLLLALALLALPRRQGAA